MRRLWVAIGLVTALMALPGMLYAQGMASFGLPNLFGRNLFEPNGNVVFYTGWLGSDRGLQFGIQTDTPGPMPIDVRTYDIAMPTRGVWFGAGANIPVADRLALLSRWWILAPSNGTAEASIVLAIPVRETQESTDTSWWYSDTLVAYNVSPGTAILAGVRFEHYQNTLKNRNWVGFPPALVDGRTDFDLSNWIPLFGLATTIGSSSNGLTFSGFYTPFFSSRVEGRMGFVAAAGPTWGPGVVVLKDTLTWGYFYEAMAEYNARLFGANTGVFARVSGLRGRTDNMQMTWNGAAWPAGLVVPYSAAYTRIGWTVGVNMSVDLGLGRLAGLL